MRDSATVAGQSNLFWHNLNTGSATETRMADSRCGGYTGELHRYENSELMEQPEVQAQLVLAVAAGGHWNDTVL